VAALHGVIYPGRRFGAKLLRPDGNHYRRQEMPFNVVAHLMCLHTLPNWHILDPFGGTGVIGLAGMRTGRRVTTVEQFPDVREAAVARWKLYYRWCTAKLGDPCSPAPTAKEAKNPYCWYDLIAVCVLLIVVVVSVSADTCVV
jgi:hypothetical protein